MSERIAALRELLENPTSNPAALGAAVAIIVLLVVVLALILIVLALPDRQEDQSDEEDEPGALPPKRPKASPFINALSAWILAVTTLVLAVVIFYESTSSDEYCSNTCHAMAKPAATHGASAHKDIACIRCHEGRTWQSMWTGLASRARSIYLQYSDARPAGARVPEGRCLECHRAAMGIELTARNGEQFRHRGLPDAGAGCKKCHGAQGHEVPVLR